MKDLFDPTSGRTQVWSDGGGVQSGAIAALIERKVLPPPHLAVMVDTERENSLVLPYVEKYHRPALASVGVELHIVRKSEFATVDLTRTSKKSGVTKILLPGFTDITGKPGKLENFCSNEWKQRVVNRWLRRVQKVKAVDTWIGFSTDEFSRRAGKDQFVWQRRVYPLVAMGMNRAACIRVVEEMGWPKPPRSACFQCSNQHNDEWASMKRERPDDFAKAVTIERSMNALDPNFWLHPLCIPLDQIDFDSLEAEYASKNTPGGGCQSGLCFV